MKHSNPSNAFSPGFRVISLLATAALLLAACAVALSGTAQAGSSGGVSTGDSGGSSADDAKYERVWKKKVKRREKRWARRTSKCESGRDPKAIGGGGKYRGAFQFLKSTWRRAPKSPGGDPIKYPYKTQAVVAVALKRRDGAGHWPNCG